MVLMVKKYFANYSSLFIETAHKVTSFKGMRCW